MKGSCAAEGFNVKIPFIRQSHTRTRNLVKYHPRVVFTESFPAMVSTDEEVCSRCDRHCKVQEKPHRDREPSRLPIKRLIISSTKKRKARRKLKRIFRKSTPNSSSLYTDCSQPLYSSEVNAKNAEVGGGGWVWGLRASKKKRRIFFYFPTPTQLIFRYALASSSLAIISARSTVE